MEDVPTIVDRAAAAGAGAGGRAALDDLRRHGRTTLRAAFAYAKRREQDPATARAADVLEVALMSRRGAFRGARWYDRLEVLIAGLLVVNLGHIVLNVARFGPVAAVLTLALLAAVSVTAVRWWRRRVEDGATPAALTFLHPPAAGRVHELSARLSHEGERAAAEGATREELTALLQNDAVLPDHPYGALIGAAALSTVERLTAGTFNRRRADLLAAAGTARRALLTEERTAEAT